MKKIYIFCALTLMIAKTQNSIGQIAAWDFTGAATPAVYPATTFNANLVTSSSANNITRGANASASTGINSFRTLGFQNDGISTTNTDYFQVTLGAISGYKVSLSTMDATFAGTPAFYASPGVISQFAYSLDGITFTLIGSPVTTTSLTLAQINLSGVTALQNVNSGTTIIIRYYASGQTTTGGWGFISSAGSNGLAIGGTVTPTCTSQTILGISTTDSRTYGATAYTLGASASSGLIVGYTSSNSGVATISGNNVTIVNVGTTTITASQPGNGTYCAATNVTQILTVDPKTLTISGLSANDKPFDGNTTATLSGTPGFVGVLAEDVASVTLGGAPLASFPTSASGGPYPVTVTGYTISGAKASNYALTQPTGLTASIIAPANSITLSPATQAKGPYCNAAANSVSLTYTITGTITAPFIELSNAAGSFASGTTNLGGIESGSGTFTITGNLPAGQTAGTVYKIRVKSTNATPVFSLDNNSSITIYAQPTLSANAGGATTVCIGSVTPAFTNATAGGTWSITPGTGIATTTAGGVATGTAAGTVIVVYTTTNGTCTATATSLVTVNALPVNPAGSITVSANPSCGPASLSYPIAVAPLVNYWQTSTSGTSTTSPTSTNYTLNSTSTVYVRTYNSSTSCWSTNSLGSGSVTVNTPISITTQPVDVTVSSPSTATFTVVATGTSPTFQWQIYNGAAWVNVTAVAPYSGTTTNTLTINPTTVSLDDKEYRCVVTGLSPCTSVTSNSVILSVNPGPCISEGFSSGTTAPSGWVFNGISGIYTTATNYGASSPSIQFSATSDRVITLNTGSNASELSFWLKGQGSTGSSFLIEGYNGSSWITIQNITTLPTTGTNFIYNSSTTPALPTNLLQFRFTYTKSSGNLAFDDVIVQCNAPVCTPTATLTKFTPAYGPEGTWINIAGSGFTGATAVKFGGQAAVAFTVESSTLIKAKVPVGAGSGKVSVTVGSCSASSSGSFAVTGGTGTCGTGGSGSVAGDISISEVYNAASGGLSYIEIFNGTSSSVTLGAPYNYVLRISTGTSTNNDYALSGTLASGAVYIVRIGAGTICSGFTPNLDLTSASGFNGNDRIYLRKNNTDIDYVPNPNYGFGNTPGFSQRRKATTTASNIPSTSYTPSDWIISTTEDCIDLGIPPYKLNAINVVINTSPSDVGCAPSPFSFNGTATATPSPVSSYAWYYNDPAIMSGWQLVSGNIAAASGTNAVTLTLTGNLAAYQGFQFYLQATKINTPDTCRKISNAAQYLYPTKKYYRSLETTGNWTTPGSWEMSDNAVGPYVATCTYPVAENSDDITIRTGHKITLAASLNIPVDKLAIQIGAELEISTGGTIKILNGQAGADFLVNGTLTDRGSSGNGVDYETGASWALGSSANIIKTSASSVAKYRDNYETGISNIPATATWRFRYNSDGTGPITLSTGMFYPNLYFESFTTGFNWNTFTTAMTGSTGGFATVKGNLDIGTTGSANVSVNYNNINSQAMLVYGNVTIGPGSTFTNVSYDNVVDASHGDGTGLELKGDLTVHGNLILNGGSRMQGRLIFSGSSAANQVLSGTGILNLENVAINNSGSGVVMINKNIDIPATLDFGSASSKLTLGSGNITLKSFLTRTANVGVIPAGATINYAPGKFIVERILRNSRKWRLLAAPTFDPAQTINSSWQENFAVPTGYGVWLLDTRTNWNTLGFDGLGTNSSLKIFNGPTREWYPVANTAISLNANKGYMVFVAGDRNMRTYPGSTQTNLRTSGQLYRDNQSVIIPANEFATVANPYPSRIDMRTITKSSSNISDAFYIWDPTITSYYGLGAWNTFSLLGGNYVNTVNSSIYGIALTPNNYIESGQAFMMKNYSVVTSPVIVKETDKATGSSSTPASFTSGIPQMLQVNFSLNQIGSTPVLLDGVIANFSPDYYNGIDGNDIFKLSTFGEQVAWKTADSILVIDRRADITDHDTLHLNLSRMRLQQYQWELTTTNLDYPGRTGFLVDRYLNTSTSLNLAGATVVNFSIENIPASYVPDRFYILFRQTAAAPLPVTITSIKAVRESDRSIQVQWQVSNETGISDYEIQRSSDGIHFMGIGIAKPGNGASALYSHIDVQPFAADNFYRVRASGTNGLEQYSAVVKVGPLSGKSLFSIFPNPVQDGQLHFQLSGEPVGNYSLQLLNATGQVVYKTVINVTGQVQVESIPLPAHVGAGQYSLRLSAPGRKNRVIPVQILR